MIFRRNRSRVCRGGTWRLQGYSDAFLDQARAVERETGARVVMMCNVGTEEVQPSPLDWAGTENVLALDPAVYRTTKRAVEGADPEREVVVVLYHPTEEVVSIYTVAPEPDSTSQS